MIAKSSRLKKATYSVVLLALYELTVFISSLILPRLILVSYGSEYNGIVSSITQFLAFITILRLGVAGATRFELYKSLSTNDTKKTSAIINATERFMRKIAGIFVGYLILLAIIYPLIIHSSYSMINISSLVLIIGLGTFAQYFFGITYSTLLQADQKLYIYNIIQIVAIIINTISAIILIKLGMSIQVVKFGSAIIYTISPLVLYFYVRKHYNIDKNVEPDNTALNRRGDVVAHSVANIVNENTDVVVLTLLTNVKIVSIYTVYNLVISGLKQFVNIFTSGIESAFGDMWVKNENDNLYKNLSVFEFFISVFISIVFTCAFALIIPFIKIYTFGVKDVNYIIPVYAYLALAACAFYCFRMPYLIVTQAAGKYKETKNGAFTEAGINIVLSVLLTLKFGIIGVVIGTLAANCFRTIQYSLFVSKQLLPRSKAIALNRTIWIVLNITLSLFAINAIKTLFGISVNNWIGWIELGFISMALGSIITLSFSILFYKNDFQCFFIKAKRILNRKKV